MFTLEQIREFLLNNPVFWVDYPNRYLQNLGGQGAGISFTVHENPNAIMIHYGENGHVGELTLNQLDLVYDEINLHPADHDFRADEFEPVAILPPYTAALVLFMHNRHPQHGGIGNNHAHYEALHGPLWLPPMN